MYKRQPEYISIHLGCQYSRSTSSCGNVDESATEPFLLLHREHGTGCRRSWNCCDGPIRLVVIRGVHPRNSHDATLPLPLPLLLIPLSPPFPSFLPLEVGLLIPARGLAEHWKLSQPGQGKSPSRNRIWCILALKYDIWWPSSENTLFDLSMGTRILTDSVMRPRSSSRGRNTSVSVTVTVQEFHRNIYYKKTTSSQLKVWHSSRMWGTTWMTGTSMPG